MPPSVSRAGRTGALLLAYSHATVDFYQGALAALVPLLVLDRGHGYAAAAGIVLAGSLSSSVVQPLFGVLGDRWPLRWLIPVAVVAAGGGIAGVAVSDSLWATAAFAALSGTGVAAYHPAAARRAREASGGDHVVMAWFSLGGNIGFVAAPLVVAGTVGAFGPGAGPLLAVPALTGLLALAWAARAAGAEGAAVRAARAGGDGNGGGVEARDDWRSFVLLSGAIVCRSIVFVGIGSFLVLFVHRYAGVGAAGGTAALFVFYLGGAFGTALGGHLARRWERTRILRWAYGAAVPVVACLVLVPGPAVFVFVALASLLLYVPFSLHVSLGQDYLPRHMGTASGVTLGLAVSVGGIAAPVIGALADAVGLRYALMPLIALPAVACLVLLRLREPVPAVSEGRPSEDLPAGRSGAAG